eukprot:4531953-Pyramimonas_sp.AAC.1
MILRGWTVTLQATRVSPASSCCGRRSQRGAGITGVDDAGVDGDGTGNAHAGFELLRATQLKEALNRTKSKLDKTYADPRAAPAFENFLQQLDVYRNLRGSAPATTNNNNTNNNII